MLAQQKKLNMIPIEKNQKKSDEKTNYDFYLARYVKTFFGLHSILKEAYLFNTSKDKKKSLHMTNRMKKRGPSNHYFS